MAKKKSTEAIESTEPDESSAPGEVEVLESSEVIERPKPHLIEVELVHSADGQHFFGILGVPDLDGQPQSIVLSVDEIEHIYLKTRQIEGE